MTNMEKKVPECTMTELYDLMIKAIKECKRQDDEKAEKEYQKVIDRKKGLNPLF